MPVNRHSAGVGVALLGTVDAADREAPFSGIVVAGQRDGVSDVETELFGESLADDATRGIANPGLALGGGEDEFGIEGQEGLELRGEGADDVVRIADVRKENARGGNLSDVWNPRDLVAVGDGQRLDDRRQIPRDEAVGRGRLDAQKIDADDAAQKSEQRD